MKFNHYLLMILSVKLYFLQKFNNRFYIVLPEVTFSTFTFVSTRLMQSPFTVVFVSLCRL